MARHQTTGVLVVEDDPIDARAVRRAFESSSTDFTVEVVGDGDSAISFLTSSDRFRPDLVLLDLNLPGRDGFDVLEWVKSDPGLRRIPIIVVTTSSSDADVAGSYDRGANAFVTKPSDLEGWRTLVAHIASFWLTVARLPRS